MELNFNVDLFEWTAWKKGHFHEMFLEQWEAAAHSSGKEIDNPESDDALEQLGPFFVELTRNIAKKLYRHTPDDRLEYLVGYKSEIARNQIIIHEIWIQALEKAMLLWFVARDIFSYYVKDSDNEKQTAICSVYSRGLLIYREILALCTQGFADGALARWRTLHEVSVVLRFLTENESEISRRFLASEKIRTLRIQKSVYERQNISPKSLRNFLNKFDIEINKLKAEFGDSIIRDWGWAYPNKKGPFNFKNIEDDSSYTSVRPWVRASSALVHASHLWPEQLLGTPPWDDSGQLSP